MKGVSVVVQAVGVMSFCSGCAMSMGLTERFVQFDYCQEHPEAVYTLPRTFLRTLIMPGLVEEVVWRVLFQPPGMNWGPIVAINAAFAIYHVFGSAVLAENFDGRRGARAVFCNPTFVSLAFVLGNLCSYVYIRAGYALWAPVLAHAVPVAVWLSLLGGETALSTPGGLPELASMEQNSQTCLLSEESSNDETSQSSQG